MNEDLYGYPIEECTKCQGITGCTLNVRPYFKSGGDTRLMLIGQDPTIFRKQERVNCVLMLDDPNSQLSRWLKGMFGAHNFDKLTIYATNIVKCTFSQPPSITQQGGLKFLLPYFEHCKKYLLTEIQQYKPTLVITLGEPAHKLFRSMINEQDKIDEAMKLAFTGHFVPIKVGNSEFSYSPCLHIKTFRVAETYGQSVTKFKEGLKGFI